MPEDLEVREALVRLHSLRGDFARHHGGLQTARSEYEEAILGAMLLVQRKPINRGYRLLLATAHDGLGDALEQVADLESARQHYEAALAIRCALKKESPQDPQLLQEVVASHLLLGDLAQAQGKQRSALTAYEQAMTMLEPLWKSDPDNKGYRWQMCGVQYRLSRTLLHLGRSIDSLALAERAMDLLGRISPTDQQGSSYHVLYSRILQMRGTVRERLGRTVDAEKDFRASYQEVSALLKAAPNDVQAKRAVIDSGVRLVDHGVRRGSMAEIDGLALELGRLAEQLFASDESNHGHRWRLAATLQRQGDVELQRGHAELAQKLFQRALELQESLSVQAPTAARHRDRLAGLLERLGDALVAGPYVVQALPRYDEALRQIRQQEQLESGWFELRLCQARILRKRATVYAQLGRRSQAEADQQQAAELLGRLEVHDPADATVQSELATLKQIATTDLKQAAPVADKPDSGPTTQRRPAMAR